jgi:hypothetical protein
VEAVTQTAQSVQKGITGAASSTLSTLTNAPLNILGGGSPGTAPGLAAIPQTLSASVQSVGNAVTGTAGSLISSAAANNPLPLTQGLQNLGAGITQGASGLISTAANAPMPLAPGLQAVEKTLAQGTQSLLSAGAAAPVPIASGLQSLQKGVTQAASGFLPGAQGQGGSQARDVSDYEQGSEASSTPAKSHSSDKARSPETDDEKNDAETTVRAAPRLAGSGSDVGYNVLPGAGTPASGLAAAAPVGQSLGPAPQTLSARLSVSLTPAAAPAMAAFVNGAQAVGGSLAALASSPAGSPRIGLQTLDVTILPDSPLASAIPQAASTLASSPLAAIGTAALTAGANALTTSLNGGGQATTPSSAPGPNTDDVDESVKEAIAAGAKKSLTGETLDTEEAPAPGPADETEIDPAVAKAIAAGARQGLLSGSATNGLAAPPKSVYTVSSPKVSPSEDPSLTVELPPTPASDAPEDRITAANKRMKTPAPKAGGQIVGVRQPDGSAHFVRLGSESTLTTAENPSSSSEAQAAKAPSPRAAAPLPVVLLPENKNWPPADEEDSFTPEAWLPERRDWPPVNVPPSLPSISSLLPKPVQNVLSRFGIEGDNAAPAPSQHPAVGFLVWASTDLGLPWNADLGLAWNADLGLPWNADLGLPWNADLGFPCNADLGLPWNADLGLPWNAALWP